MLEIFKGLLGGNRTPTPPAAYDHWWHAADQDTEVLFEVETEGPLLDLDGTAAHRGIITIATLKWIADLIWDRSDEQFAFLGLTRGMSPIASRTLSGRQCIGLWVASPEEMEREYPDLKCWLPREFYDNEYRDRTPFWRE